MSIQETPNQEQPSTEQSFEDRFKEIQNMDKAPEATRPEGLPENFQSVEDLANSYKELQAERTKDSQETPKDTPTEPQEPTESQKQEEEVVTAAGLDWDTMVNEWAENGEYSKESYEALEKAGYPRQLVDDYVQNKIQNTELTTQLRENEMKASDATITETVGGEESYKALCEWIHANASDGEVDAYNNIIDTGTHEQRLMAVQGMYARYQNSEGSEPKLIHGEGQSTRSVEAFADIHEAQRALGDPRMSTDKAYRAEVMRKYAGLKGSDTHLFG